MLVGRSLQQGAQGMARIWKDSVNSFLIGGNAMMRMIGLVSVMTIALVGGGWLFGGDDKKDQPKVKGTLPPNWSKLGLSEDQKQKIYSTRGDYRTKIEELRAQIRELEKKEKGELEKILTDAQKARLREIIAEKVPGATPAKDDKKPGAAPDIKKP
jgi:hypothetical protein